MDYDSVVVAMYNSCWLDVSDPSSGVVWAFVAPMLAIILVGMNNLYNYIGWSHCMTFSILFKVNVFFFIAALRSLYKVKMQRKRMEGKGKEEEIRIFWSV